MVLLYITLSIKILCLSASNLVNYKFGSNFGQIFYDYSGLANHGQNGISLDVDAYDTIPIDRGTYFNTQSSVIKLPPNNIKNDILKLGDYFSIIMWLYPMQTNSDHRIYMRYRRSGWHDLYLKYDYESNNIYSILRYSTSDGTYNSTYTNFVYIRKH